ncbi:uncharacterized protein J8A68_000336 [[Candida] subhashii]|uniref:RGS domain-containing protein n=1 Tax=[Candida] subhashii TaxID=561895 RepID=A0A8J5V226_9ASCO|nr:uncharacterized protein J8A68_000336 [[Candida] subhashii]KAG7666080.1 hypothetical protein J8A68_000336 [[Candida] subhashii]
MKASSTTNTTLTTASSNALLAQDSMSTSISSIKTYNPIPTKPQCITNPLLNIDTQLGMPPTLQPSDSTNSSNSNSNSRSSSPSVIPPLDELVNDCFLHTINQLEDLNKLSIVESFMQYLIKQHCQENLYFLIDIYKYEFYYNKLYNNNHESVEHRLNHTPSPSLAKYMSSNASLNSIIQPSYRNNSSKRNSITTTSSCTINNDDGMFMADDLDANEYAQFNANIWEELRSRQIDDDSESEFDYQQDDEEDEEVLMNQWNYIMNTYIKIDSTCQINISQKLFKEIAEESINNSIHNPLVLIKARNETFALLKENGYSSFVSKFKSNSLLIKSNNSTISSSPTTAPTSHSLQQQLLSPKGHHNNYHNNHQVITQLVSPITNPNSPTTPPIILTSPTTVAPTKPTSAPSPAITSPTTTTASATPTNSGSNSSHSLFNKLSQLPSKKSKAEESSSSLSNLFFFRELKAAAENTNRTGKVVTPPNVYPSHSHHNQSNPDTMSPIESGKEKEDSSLSFKFWSRRK